jgi:hypothetical protein
VKKKDGTLRLCVDLRGLNKITIKNRYPLPLPSELVDRCYKAKYFTKLDLRGAYNLIRIAEGDEWKTAFRTRYGHYEYCVMPFGLTNAPASFQALINSVLKPFLDRFTVVYLDDILVYSETLEEHIQHVRQVLSKLSESDLYLKLEKCTFHASEVEFLGFIISSEGIRMDPKKVHSISTWPAPTTLQELQSFLGFINFYRKFISEISQKAIPLHALLKKDTPFIWTEEAQQAFENLKEEFTKSENGILRYYDPRKPTPQILL